jgi:hypothetical protein
MGISTKFLLIPPGIINNWIRKQYPIWRLFNLFWINGSWQKRLIGALRGEPNNENQPQSLLRFSCCPLSPSLCPGARPDLLRPPLWCGGWQVFLWCLVDAWGLVPGTHQLNPVVCKCKMGYSMGRTIRNPSTST